MKRSALAATALLAAAPALAQAPGAQSQKQSGFEFKADALARQEWTRELFGGAPDQDRWRLQLRPRLEISVSGFQLGVGGEFGYSKDENVPEPRPLLLRDNYDSRDARLDLAFGSLRLDALKLEGGRFFMPVGLTEMIWDRDLRPQGAAATLEFRDTGGLARLAFTGLWAQGSHVFEDQDAQMWIVSAGFETRGGFELAGSWIRFDDFATIEPMIRRQNTRLAGEYVHEYQVWDVVMRLRRLQGVELQLVADYCWNRKLDEDNKGLWLAAVIGSTQSARGRLEYTYAKIDKDATLAAYNSDDFFWNTGWEGHRVDMGLRSGHNGSLHGIAQWQRFKDSPRPEERDHWVRRYRLELRLRY